MSKKHYLGIEIGGTKLQMVIGDGAGRVVARHKSFVDRVQGAGGIRAHIEAVLPELISHTEPAGVGVGFGGPVDWRIGKICRSHQIEGWSEFDLAGWLRERTGKPTVVDNDGNVAALGEATCGAGKGFRKVFYITLGSGVGGGLVIGGEIYHGAIPGEAEIGHVRLDKQGTTVESRCSGWAVDARVREAIAAHPSSALARQAEGNAGGEARFLAAALASGDAAAGAILSDLADNLGFGLSHVVQLMHPEIIIIGGGLSQIGEPLRAAVESRLRAFVMEAFLPGPRVALAALGEDAVPVGALRLAGEGV